MVRLANSGVARRAGLCCFSWWPKPLGEADGLTGKFRPLPSRCILLPTFYPNCLAVATHRQLHRQTISPAPFYLELYLQLTGHYPNPYTDLIQSPDPGEFTPHLSCLNILCLSNDRHCAAGYRNHTSTASLTCSIISVELCHTLRVA